MMDTASEPNSSPEIIYIFSRKFAVKYELYMLQANKSNPFNATRVKAVHTEYHGPTDA